MSRPSPSASSARRPCATTGPAIGQPNLWTKLGIFITLIYSIYANFATDYGAMSAAMAAFGDKPPPEIPLQAGSDD